MITNYSLLSGALNIDVLIRIQFKNAVELTGTKLLIESLTTGGDSSDEGSQHMFLCRIYKNYPFLSPNTPSYLENLEDGMLWLCPQL